MKGSLGPLQSYQVGGLRVEIEPQQVRIEHTINAETPIVMGKINKLGIANAQIANSNAVRVLAPKYFVTSAGPKIGIVAPSMIGEYPIPRCYYKVTS